MLLDARLERAVESRQVPAVENLQRFCRQPSVSAQDLGVKECADLLVRMMTAAGLRARIYADHGGQPVVYGERIESNALKTLLFYNHYDVQPPDPLEEWESGPFAAEIRGGRLYGRGASDNKGNIVARLEALRCLIDTYGRLPVSIRFLAEGEEEVGSPRLDRFVDLHGDLLQADACLWEGTNRDAADRPVVALGAKGMLYVEIRVKGPSVDVHSSYSTLVENPAWRLVEALRSIRAPDGKVLLEGFYDEVEPPSEEDLRHLEGLPFQEEHQIREEYGIQRFVNGATGLDAKIAYFHHPTCNVAGLNAGYTGPGSKTVLPRTAFAKIDFRMVPRQNPSKILAALRRHLQQRGFGDFEIIEHGSYEAARTPMSAGFVRVVEAAAREIYRKDAVLHPSMAGSGPMCLFVNRLKIPTASLGIGHFASKIHAPNENIRLDDLAMGIRLLIHLLQRFAAS